MYLREESGEGRDVLGGECYGSVPGVGKVDLNTLFKDS